MKTILSLCFILAASIIVAQEVKQPSERKQLDFSKGDIVSSSSANMLGEGELSISNIPYDDYMIGVYSDVPSTVIKKVFV